VNENKQAEAVVQSRFPSFPADPSVVEAAEVTLTTKAGRIDEVCQLLLQDPVSILEILSRANRQFHANDKPAIWSIKVALMRLGTQQTLEILSELKAENSELTSSVRHEFEKLRVRALKLSRVARILAETVATQLVDECQTAALMSEVGYMYALLIFKGKYVSIAESSARKALAYKIEQDLHLDVNKFQLDYLKDKWFPQSIMFVYDSEIKCKTTQESALRFIIEGAEELLDAIETNRFERFIPPAEMPSKCALRYLNVSVANRTIITERILAELSEPVIGAQSNSELPIEVPETPAQIVDNIVPLRKEEPAKVIFFESKVEFIESCEGEFERPLNHFSEQNQKVLQMLKEFVEIEVDSALDAIEEVLAILIEDGPFKRASLIEFSPDKCNFKVVNQNGSDFELEQPVIVNSPWSPVAMASTQIRSFPSPEANDPLSPMGSNAFAISPLRGKADQRIALYADCGHNGVVPFEARRVFRVAVGVLNNILPTLE
jgi:hypothetical protein